MWTEKWKSHTDVERAFSLARNGAYALENSAGAFRADVPTLRQYGQLYGEAAPRTWVQQQLAALFLASASRDSGLADGIRQAAALISAEAAGVKLSEMLLFFARYKSGHYDDGYSQFDTRRVCVALQRFMRERREEYACIERERQQREAEASRFTPPPGYTSLSWYRYLKDRAERGDAEAQKLLKRQNETEKRTT